MRISQEERDQMFSAIHEEIMTVRLKLKLTAADDYTLAQVEHAIWSKIKRAFKMPGYA